MALREPKVEVSKYLDLCLGEVVMVILKILLRTFNIRKLDLFYSSNLVKSLIINEF